VSGDGRAGAGGGTRPPAGEPSAPSVLLEIDGSLATLRLNRPERLNALTEQSREELLAAVESLRANAGVRAVIITGAGRAFCSGGDLEKLRAYREAGDKAGFARILDGQLALTRSIRALPQIAIAAVNGACGGGGLDIALACDIRIAAQSATFGAPFLRLGILPDATALALLPLAVGESRALELFLDSGFVAADDARAQGLVSRVVHDADLLPAARQLALQVSEHPQELVAELKALLDASRRHDWSADAHRAAQLRAFEAPASLEAIRSTRGARPANESR
jgi:enoyl-CoA hydratase/carnithine racemase